MSLTDSVVAEDVVFSLVRIVRGSTAIVDGVGSRDVVFFHVVRVIGEIRFLSETFTPTKLVKQLLYTSSCEMN